VRFGIDQVYLFGSTETGQAGVGSDIDLIFVWNGNTDQREKLEAWLEGWSRCLAEVNFQLYGLPSEGVLDVKIWAPEQAKQQIQASWRAGQTLQALPLGVALPSKR